MISKAGGIALILVSVGCGLGSFALFRGYQTVEEVIQSAERHVERELVPAMKAWDPDRWEQLWADGLRESLPDRKLMIRRFSDRLGPVQVLGKANYRAIRPAPAGMGAKSVVELGYSPQFTKGAASLRLKLARIEKKWKIASITLGDPASTKSASN